MTFRPPRAGRRPLPVLLLLLGAVPAAAAAPVIPLDEITPGMAGYGLTVFAGSEIDTFGVTVVGVQRNVRVAGSLIVVEVSGHGLEQASIARGMSGSPVFLDGRLAGALSFGWSGALRPLGGVTPAGEMLAVTADPPPAAAGVAAPVVPAASDWSSLATTPAADLVRALDRNAPSAGAVAPAAAPTDWPRPEELARRLLAPHLGDAPSPAGWICHPAGSPGAGAAAAAAGGDLAPGSACAVPLVLGDAQLGAIGTVTWVQDGDVWAMGHPFMQRGPVRLPLATARILTLFPSRQMSFKLGAIGEVVGAVHQDRRPAVVGRLGAEAPLLPVAVTVDAGDGARTYGFRVADDPLLSAPLVFWTAYNALLATGDDASQQTLHWRMDVDWRTVGEAASRRLSLSGTSAGPGGAAALKTGMAAPLGLLRTNPFREVSIERVGIRLSATPGLATARVRGINAPLRLPGDASRLPLTVELEPRRGRRSTRAIELPLPPGLEPGRYRLIAASAAEFFGLEAQRAAGRFRVADLATAVALLEEPRDAATLSVALLRPGRNVVVQGRELEHLPGSVRRTVHRGHETTGRTLADFVARRDTATEWLLQGHAVLDLELAAPATPREPERRP